LLNLFIKYDKQYTLYKNDKYDNTIILEES